MMEQRSDEWYRARCGQLGASQVSKAISKGRGGAESSTKRNLIAEIVAMRLTGTAPEGFSSAAIQWGIDNEPLARSAYEISKGIFVDEDGWIPHPSIEWTGCSPDGLVGDDGLVEIKCPNTATHLDYLLAGEPPAEYKNQMLWQMECTGRKWCDFVSYDPRMPEDMQLFVVRYMRDDERLKELREGVVKFLDEVNEMLVKLQAYRESKKEQ